MKVLHIIDKASQIPSTINEGDVFFCMDDSMAGDLDKAKVSYESFKTVNVTNETSIASGINVIAKTMEVPVGRHPLWKVRANEGYAPFLTFKNSLLFPYVSKLPISQYIRCMIALDFLFKKYSLDEIYSHTNDVFMNSVIDSFRGRDISVKKRPQGWTIACLKDLIRLCMMFSLKTVKAFFRYAYARVFMPGYSKKKADVVLTSYPNFVFKEGNDVRDVLWKSLHDDLSERGYSCRFVTYDYSRKFDISLMAKKNNMVPFEAYYSFFDFLILPFQYFKESVYAVRSIMALRRQRMMYKDFNFLRIFWPMMLQYHLFYVPTIRMEKRAASRMFLTLEPRLLFMIGEYTKIGQIMIWAAKRKGIKVLGLQHGIIHKLHPGYNFGQKSDMKDYYSLPDHFFVYGLLEKDLLSSIHKSLAKRSVAVGSPRFDYLQRENARSQKKEFLKGIALDRGKKLLVFYNGFHSEKFNRILLETFHNIQANHPDWQIVYKTHPRDYNSKSYQDAAARNGKSILITGSVNTYDLLLHADLVMVTDSTLASEAIAWKKPVFILYWPEYVSFRLSWADEGLAFLSESPEDLVRSFDLFCEGKITLDDRQISRFVEYNYTRMDGCCSNRILDVAGVFDLNHK